jgi:hypothetical protein
VSHAHLLTEAGLFQMYNSPSQSTQSTQTQRYDRTDSLPPSEPSSPPRSYDPYSVSRTSSYYQSGESTAVNSIIHEEVPIPKTGSSVVAKIGSSVEVKTKPRSYSKLEAAEIYPTARSFATRVREHFMAEVNTDMSCIPLVAYCFLTGYVSLP